MRWYDRLRSAHNDMEMLHLNAAFRLSGMKIDKQRPTSSLWVKVSHKDRWACGSLHFAKLLTNSPQISRTNLLLLRIQAAAADQIQLLAISSESPRVVIVNPRNFASTFHPPAWLFHMFPKVGVLRQKFHQYQESDIPWRRIGLCHHHHSSSGSTS